MALVVEDIVKNFGEGLSETKVLKGINFEMVPLVLGKQHC